MDSLIDDYIAAHISEEPALLNETYRFTNNHHLYPRMCSGHVQGRILKMLTAMIAPRRIIELGCYTGYSSLCLAEGMPADCQLHTVEIDDELEDELLERFSRSPQSDRIHLHIGDALGLLPGMKDLGPWDMALIDANKRNYVDYLELLLPQMRPGGFILADNTLWSGKVVDPTAHDPQTLAIRRFNDYVARHPRLDTAILPLRDGLTLLRVKPL